MAGSRSKIGNESLGFPSRKRADFAAIFSNSLRSSKALQEELYLVVFSIEEDHLLISLWEANLSKKQFILM